MDRIRHDADLHQVLEEISKYTGCFLTASRNMLPIPQFLRPIIKKLVSIPGRFTPYSAQQQILSVALNEAFREPIKQGEISLPENAKIRIKVTDLHIDWLIEALPDRFNPIDRNLKDDVCISGESLDFILLATRQADPDTLFFQRRIRIEGDTELGLGIKNTIDAMDWDDLPVPLRKFLQGLGQVIEKLQQRQQKNKPALAK